MGLNTNPLASLSILLDKEAHLSFSLDAILSSGYAYVEHLR